MTGAEPAGELHGRPTAGELVEAVREFLEGTVMEATSGHVQFHTRVAVNVLRIVERELATAAEHGPAHAGRLARFGVADDAELAAAIRAGDLDDRLDEVRSAVLADVTDKLSVANPRWLERPA